MTLSRTLLPLALGSLVLLGACNPDQSSENTLSAVANPYSAVPERGMVHSGLWLVFVADEATSGPTGTDLNEDGDVDDQVAIAQQVLNGLYFSTGMIVVDFVVCADQVYLAVDEAEDDRDWNADGAKDDVVLIHWTNNLDPVVLDDLDMPEQGLFAVCSNNNLFYTVVDEPTQADETNLRKIQAGLPNSPIPVTGELGGETLHPTILGEDEYMVFLGADELREGRDLNGDGDAQDQAVLGLLPSNTLDEPLRLMELALNPEDPTWGASYEGGSIWRVAFLVNEFDQGESDLDDPQLFPPEWRPVQCPEISDGLTNDDVLHFLLFEEWVAGTSGPVNTGLSGRDRAVLVKDYVGTVVDESRADCDLNLDMQLDDTVARWSSMTDPPAPNVLPDNLLAVAELPGEAHGLAFVNDGLVISVDEVADSRDHNADGLIQDVLVGWILPDRDFLWTFLLQDPKGSFFYVSADWLADEEQGGRLPADFREQLDAVSLNGYCGLAPPDGDVDDNLPVWLRIQNEVSMLVPGVGYALEPGNPGLEIAANVMFFRVSETEDGRDHNLDGDTDDLVVIQNSVFTCNPGVLGTSMDLAGPAVVSGGNTGGGFFSDEAMAGKDLNGDGDQDDIAVMWFRL